MEPCSDVDEFVAAADGFARAVLATEDPYELGIKFMGFCLRNVEVVDFADGLYCIWGVITDGVDGPKSDEFEEWAYGAMRRAAGEWLALPPNDAAQRLAYIDRWVYDECRYARPDAT